MTNHWSCWTVMTSSLLDNDDIIPSMSERSQLYFLPQVVGIELLGYRKRLQYGIAELRSAHPEWLDNRWSMSFSPSSSRSVSLTPLG